MRLTKLLEWLDNSFSPYTLKDPSQNGLQIQAPEEVRTIAFAVDACMQSFESAADADADLLVVHHGLYWRDIEKAVGMHYQRLKYMFEREIGLYAMHLPLDAHPQLGNNRQLAVIAEADDYERFAPEDGIDIGGIAHFNQPRPLEQLTELLNKKLDTVCRVLNHGPKEVSKLGIVSGGGSSYLSDAILAGCDAFLTGDADHIMYHVSREHDINVLMGGHYATETVGLKALQQAMNQDLSVNTTFISIPTGL